MVLETRQQLLKLLRTGKNILITTRARPSADGVASALAFYLWLKKCGKKASIAIDSAGADKINQFAFLPSFEMIEGNIKPNGRLAVEFNLGAEGIKGLTYKIADEKLIINIMPNNPALKLGWPNIKQASFDYDLIIVLDSPDLESLGKVYDDHTELFYNTPIINIDNSIENEHFGELNLIELTAVSATEIIFTLLEHWQKEWLDADIATCLLCGIVSKSQGWQKNNVTPRSLSIASELIVLGAKRELINENLFGNKTVGFLQICGRALARLRTDPENGFVWSVLSATDFIETNTDETAGPRIIEDFFERTPQAKIVALFLPSPNSQKAVIYTSHLGCDLRQVFSSLNAFGSRSLVECIVSVDSSDEAMDSIKQIWIERTMGADQMPKF